MQNQTTICFCLFLVDIIDVSSDIFQVWIGLRSMFSSFSLIWWKIFHRDERWVSLKWCLNLTQAATNWNRLRKFVVSMVSSCLIRKWLKFLGNSHELWRIYHLEIWIEIVNDWNRKPTNSATQTNHWRIVLLQSLFSISPSRLEFQQYKMQKLGDRGRQPVSSRDLLPTRAEE